MADPEKAKNQLLKNAIQDSKEKANVLAGAAGVTLGDISLIDYSWGEMEFISRPMESVFEEQILCCKSEESGAYDVDIEPDDINVSDTVTVVWKIL